MRVIKRTFRPHNFYWMSGLIGMCTSQLERFLQRHFDLPVLGKISSLTLSLYTKPGEDRLRLYVSNRDYLHLRYGGRYCYGNFRMDLCLARYAGKALYLQVEYVDK